MDLAHTVYIIYKIERIVHADLPWTDHDHLLERQGVEIA